MTGIDGESESYPEGDNSGKGENDWEKIYLEKFKKFSDLMSIV